MRPVSLLLRPLLLALLVSSGCANLGRNMVEGHFARQMKKAELAAKRLEIDGQPIAYVEGGDAEGPVVVMVHGFSGDKSNWYAFARYLAEDHHLYALDLPPFGESPELPGRPYDIRTHAAALASFLAAVGVERAHLVGNSMGGHTIGLFALEHPEQVMSLALFDAAGVRSPVKSEAMRLGEEGKNPFEMQELEDVDRLMALTFVDPPMMPGPAKRYFFEQRRARDALNARLLEDYLASYVDLQPDLPKISAPTLVLWGDGDRITDPSAVQVFADGLPNETVVIMEKCGHSPMMERPEETARHYRAFLASLAAGD
ncbi:MAG: alpha/beta fold hydrolase [Deltaproteobacteria bacterium]|nr:alpha/beta fold hydrolase [Deltaproteobacteria bacterium]